MAGYKNKLWICAKCGRVFDGYEIYDNLPTYGLKKHKTELCHICRKKYRILGGMIMQYFNVPKIALKKEKT